MLPVVLVVLAGALALTETLVAKMRILLAPRLLAVGAAAALLGVLTWLVESGPCSTAHLLWALVASGLAVVVVRRRSIVVAIVTAQALALAVAALLDAETADDVLAAGALALRAVLLAVLFAGVVARTRERRPVHARVPPLLRAGLGRAARARAHLAHPPIGLDSQNAERAVLSLIAFGIATAGLRRATVLQVLGIVLVENGLALAALELPGETASARRRGRRRLRPHARSPLVAAVFHQRIFGLFGAGDTAA